MPIPENEIAQLTELMTVRHDMRNLLAAVQFDQLIPAPEFSADAETAARCARLHDRFVSAGTDAPIPDAAFDVPKWVFLEFEVRQRGMLVHGSGDPTITLFEPRAAQDNLVGGERPRVYAASSGLLAGFYAVVDRDRLAALPVIPAMNNLYVTRRNPNGVLREAFQFALDYRALPHAPWRTGSVYVLPGETFSPDAQEQQWWSEAPVHPRARVTLAPGEWPLLSQVRGVDFVALLRRSAQGLEGMPWWGDRAIYPTAPAKHFAVFDNDDARFKKP